MVFSFFWRRPTQPDQVVIGDEVSFHSKPQETVLEFGRGLGFRRLYSGKGQHLPGDLEAHRAPDGTTTWYSRSEGDQLGYFRCYGNGLVSIHVGTWYSVHELKAAIARCKTEVERKFYAATLKELYRRTTAIHFSTR